MINYFFKLQNKRMIYKIKNLSFANFATKIIPITLGDLGEGTRDATIKQWYKNIGDIVKEVRTINNIYRKKL